MRSELLQLYKPHPLCSRPIYSTPIPVAILFKSWYDYLASINVVSLEISRCSRFFIDVVYLVSFHHLYRPYASSVVTNNSKTGMRYDSVNSANKAMIWMKTSEESGLFISDGNSRKCMYALHIEISDSLQLYKPIVTFQSLSAPPPDSCVTLPSLDL